MAQKRNGLTVKAMGFIISILMLQAGSASADEWSDIFKATMAKYAGYEKKIKDMTTFQEIRMITPMRELTSDSKAFKKGIKFRLETQFDIPELPKEMGSMQSVVIYDGKETWMISSMLGRQKLSGGEEAQYQAGQDWWSFLPEQAELVGSEKIDEHDCHVVKFEEPGAVPYSRIWIDKEGLVLVKAVAKGPGGKEVVMTFSDFRKIPGDWEVPYKTEVYMGEQLVSTVLVKSIEINTGLSDDLFDPEKVETKGPSMEEMMKKMQESDEGGE